MKEYWKENKYELITTFFIFTNLFPAWFPQWTYYVSFAMIALKFLKFEKVSHPKAWLFGGLIAFLWFTTIIGNALDLRLVLFTIVLWLFKPSGSQDLHDYKVKLMKNIYWGFGLVTLANFYAKLAGINMKEGAAWMEAHRGFSEFSGFATHSMWTSCAAAISATFFVSLAFRKTDMSKGQKIVCYGMILISLYITMISASRAAFFLALACSALIIWMQTEKFTTLMRNVLIVGFTALFFAPFLMDNSAAMLNKKNALKVTTKNTSRDELWTERMAEFHSSPVIGIGFAAHGVGRHKTVGRNESGGGFISVLAQTGIIGILFIALIWAAATTTPRRIGHDPNMILIYSSFVFFSIHNILEGYMFQAGWYLCLVIWLIIGIMIEHKTLPEEEYEEAEYEEDEQEEKLLTD